MRISAERYRLMRSHHWDEKVIRRLTEDGSKRRKKRAGG